jgi:hypothetical protein
MPFTGTYRRTNSQGRLRAKAREGGRATASAEFGGFRAFRAVVKVASLRLRTGANVRGEIPCDRSNGSRALVEIHAASHGAG